MRWIWEKMSLGEWFNYLEVNLPKQIMDAIEEMIMHMKQKAEKIHEFIYVAAEKLYR